MYISAEFNEIWQFVERKMRVEILPFMKYVLKFCGYDDCYSISTIEEKDFAYFESEVRKGGIIEFYDGKISEKDLMTGSPRSIENFENVAGCG